MKQEWISVKDRLPEWATEAKRGQASFLVFDDNRKMTLVAHLSNQTHDRFPGRRLWICQETLTARYNVTHWCALPEPPVNS